jgi:hypothetical protein
VAIVLFGVGGLAILAAAGLLASFGERLRVGRLLAGTPEVELADLPSIAASPGTPYVRVEGRIDSDEPFEDAAHRPLVFRRTRVQVRGRLGWRTVDEGLESVPFALSGAGGEAAIDPADLDAGLVVISREASGVAADIADRVPPETPPETPVRVRIDQVSSVEHAIVLGVPQFLDPGASGASGGSTASGAASIALRPAPGRPLVLTTLEQPEAMRILADGRQLVIRAAVVLFVAGGACVAAGVGTALLGLAP